MRVLILSASTGGGHNRASSALKEIILKEDGESTVKIVDSLDYVNKNFGITISDGYEFLAKNTPKLYGSIYNRANRDSSFSSFASMITVQFSKKLLPLILDFQPDIIVTVHAFAAEMISELKEKYSLNLPLVCIITDYSPHKMYINDGVTAYVVSTLEMVEGLAARGVDKNIIHEIGIPISPVFYNEYDKKALRAEMELDPDLQTLLIMAGSFGVSDILRIYDEISRAKHDFQIIVVTGRNRKLYDSFEKILQQENTEVVTPAEKNKRERSMIKKMTDVTQELREKTEYFMGKTEQWMESIVKRRVDVEDYAKKPTKLLYFVSDIERYMAASDLIVTKPGGLTVTESLKMHLPLAIFKAFPGQEEENADFLIRKNMAVMLPENERCTEFIRQLLADKNRLETMKKNCENFVRNRSISDIYNLLEDQIKKSKKERQEHDKEEVT